MAFPGQPFGYSPPRPDFGFPPGVMPFFGGWQPQRPFSGALAPPPPPPPPPPPAPAAPALVNLANAPGGICYLFPAKHTAINLIPGNLRPWETRNEQFHFTRFSVPSNISVGELIRLLSGGGSAPVTVTECLEHSRGRWDKGVSIASGDAAASKTLAAVGWHEGRGSANPVWVVLRR
ncbi:MAG: hypothetical protein M1826_003098 [Phylliscum demangeonii]|nr:MAG: hypothetical protein M1826_003098 [Phylliscum demangeonii]